LINFAAQRFISKVSPDSYVPVLLEAAFEVARQLGSCFGSRLSACRVSGKEDARLRAIAVILSVTMRPTCPHGMIVIRVQFSTKPVAKVLEAISFKLGDETLDDLSLTVRFHAFILS